MFKYYICKKELLSLIHNANIYKYFNIYLQVRKKHSNTGNSFGLVIELVNMQSFDI